MNRGFDSLPFPTVKENMHDQFSTSHLLKDKGNFLLNFILNYSTEEFGEQEEKGVTLGNLGF